MRPATIIAAACLLLMLAGCGKKEWPTPRVSEDRFGWLDVKGGRADDCLLVNIQVSGNFENVSVVTLQLEPIGEGDPSLGCPTCPFQAREVVDFVPGQPGLEQNGPFLTLSHCGLRSDVLYRWRIVGTNRLPDLGEVRSEVFTTP